jgi:hypothetical protein
MLARSGGLDSLKRSVHGSSRGRKNALACAYAIPLGLKNHLELQIVCL